MHQARHRHGHQHGPGHRLTRAQFLRLAAGGAAVVASGPLGRPALAQSAPADPKPINGSAFPPFRIYGVQYKEGGPPAVYSQSTITDFDGVFGSTDVTGWGTDHLGRELYFRCDMRVMQGAYVGVDGQRHVGTFGFI